MSEQPTSSDVIPVEQVQALSEKLEYVLSPEPPPCFGLADISPSKARRDWWREGYAAGSRDAAKDANALIASASVHDSAKRMIVRHQKSFDKLASASVAPPATADAFMEIGAFCRHRDGCPQLTALESCACGLLKAQNRLLAALYRIDMDTLPPVPVAPPASPWRPIMVDRDADLRVELRAYLGTLTITSDNIGDIRRSLFMPWDSAWNGWVRDETAERENRPSPPQEPQP